MLLSPVFIPLSRRVQHGFSLLFQGIMAGPFAARLGAAFGGAALGDALAAFSVALAIFLRAVAYIRSVI